MGGQENNLTSDEESDIIPSQLTADEARILKNMRKQASGMHNGEFDVTFGVHHDEIKWGDVKAVRQRL